MNRDLERAAAQSQPRQSSHREFGFVMALACLVLSIVIAWRRGGMPPIFLPALTVCFALASAFCPQLLAPLNAAWSLIGRLLHRLFSPLVLGVLYYGLITPFGLVFRWIKKDPLRLERNSAIETYWIRREGADRDPGRRMRDQF